jgi:predicted RNA binding protein YcfA (HicA-like mRNA interferase family)
VKELSGREFAKIIERHGWNLLRVHGGHLIYGKPGSTIRLSIPAHGNQPLKRGLLAHLTKLAGLQESDLVSCNTSDKRKGATKCRLCQERWWNERGRPMRNDLQYRHLTDVN